MGRKPKKVQKKQEVDASDEENEQVRPSNHKNSQECDLKDIFSGSFRERLSKCISLTSQVLNLKGKIQDKDVSAQITERNSRMADRVEQVAADILRVELGSLEDWIGEQQISLSQEMVKLSQCYDANKRSLLSTNAFNEVEVVEQLKAIQDRSDEKQLVYDSYTELLQNSKKIYS